jgi:hypothetical protein
MFMKARGAIMAAAIASAVAVTGIAPSFAGTMTSGAPVTSGYNSGDLVLVADRKVVKKRIVKKKVVKKRWAYNSRRHGHRYRHKRPGFAYYYGGHWYARPFWRITINF